MYKYVCTFVKGMSTGRWIPSSANSFCSSSVIITDPVLNSEEELVTLSVSPSSTKWMHT